MSDDHPVLWKARKSALLPANVDKAKEIVTYAKQLTKRDMKQIVSAFESEHYEMASSFVWKKTMSSLRRQLSKLGMKFIGEMLQRPDIDDNSDIESSVTDSEAISLAEHLGMVNQTESLRLRHALETVNHFAALDSRGLDEEADDQYMTKSEAVQCLRASVRNILGHPRLEVAQDFARFRQRLEEETLNEDDREISALCSSPYFYKKTALSVLLALIKTTEGAQLLHTASNMKVILPLLWKELKKPERWQVGQTYAELHNWGKKKAAKGLRRALLLVSGFDYVPENLRSETFAAAAKAVLVAHQGINNYHNEPAPMKELVSLGAAIPNPAFSKCMTAILSVRLGNSYNRSWAAQGSVLKLLRGLSTDRWIYYLEECLPNDDDILFKLMSLNSCNRWIELVEEFKLKPSKVESKIIKDLLAASKKRNFVKVSQIANKIRKFQRRGR